MEVKKKNIECRYFKSGCCKNGDRCPYLHTPNNPSFSSNPSPQNNETESHICRHFIKDDCSRKNCAYFHGYLEKLEFVTKIDNHKKDIQCLIKMDDKKFVSSDISVFFVRMIEGEEIKFFNYEVNESEYKIGKVSFFNNKVILGMEKQTM